MFGRFIRTELNWDAAARSGCHVSTRNCRLRTELGEFHTVWYLGPHGGRAGVNDPSARPLRVREAGAPALLTAERNLVVREFENEFVRAGAPATLELPVYETESGVRILLDGNHRAVAAHRSGLPVDLLIHRLHGPADAAILPDLVHYRG
ncbi:hypothetical protein SAMN05216266_109115 [Amycolatopsis marina]|uniref:Uncharacterized protein n=2 Tax=Amycolatopsis marina TaxID=490629 RepID=A0A1I1AKN5_9PSEU|nr:hypothetical protein SAMN05216266_109115 [Amycolatopsis marina]